MANIRVSEISIKNFRAIKDSTIDLQQDTILLGKNNIGKTSLLDAFQSFAYGLKISDINLALLISIMKNKDDPNKTLSNQCVEFSITYHWKELGFDYWSLLSNISNSGNTKILIRYTIPQENYAQLKQVKNVNEIIELFKKEISIGSVDDFKVNRQTPLPANTKLSKYMPLPKSNIDDLKPGELLLCTIKAFRFVDSGKTDSENVTANQFSAQVFNLLSDNAEVTRVFSNVQKQVDQDVAKKLDPFQTELKKFAYPQNPKNPLKAILTIDEWLANPKVRISQTFKDLIGFELPLNAQGLGYQNIYNILARISAQFSKMKKLRLHNPVFFAIEEPEAFTHPQLQHIFVQQIRTFIQRQAEECQIPYQLLIISHSPEIAISAFEMNFQIVIGRRQGNFSYFINWDKVGSGNPESRNKLKKLIINYNAEMLFADKLIAYEGNAERLILTALIRKEVAPLLGERIAFIPVGTAFKKIEPAIADLRFNKVLLITDIDYKCSDKTFKIEDPCHVRTTNGNLIYLLDNPTGDSKLKQIDLTSYLNSEDAYICKKHVLVPSDGIPDPKAPNNFMIVTQGYSKLFNFWPRTLESALVFASKENFSLYKTNKLLKDDVDTIKTQSPYDLNDISGKLLTQGKADFALDSLDLIANENYRIPQYLMEGLKWLEN